MIDGTVGRDAHHTFAAVGGLCATVPIVLLGSLAAIAVAVPSAADAAPAPIAGTAAAATPPPQRHDIRIQVRTSGPLGANFAAYRVEVPSSYVVVPGDTVSDIAARFGLATTSVLAINGLSWSSLIFPGQRLSLAVGTPAAATDQATAGGNYTIAAGDTISAIAARYSVSTLSVLAANGLNWSSIIYPGQTLMIPGQIGPGSDSSRGSVDSAAGALAPPQAPAQPTQTAAPAPVQPAIPVADSSPPTTYAIASGDTISAIAARWGLTTQELLDANGLDWSSMIYPGHTLLIPTGAQASNSPATVGLDPEMARNAAIIAHVGRDLGVSDNGIVIALAAAAQESGLRNLSWGDLDSVGLFQQRPSAGWGTVDELTTPNYAARLFFGGPTNPNAGITRGLLDMPGWENMSVAEAAQSVQISAYPDAYARWESSARTWLGQVG